MRKEIRCGEKLFELYILAAEALLNRADFGILAASEFLEKPHAIDKIQVKNELLRLKKLYLAEYMCRQTPAHAVQITHTIFDTLLEYLN